MPPHGNQVLKSIHSYDNSTFQFDENIKKPQYRRAISCQAYQTLYEEPLQDVPTSAPPTSAYVSIVIPEILPATVHRPMKTGRQRVRWNLIFNILVWIICPLPIWLPFLSNTVAIYLLPSIQGIFAFIWFIISLLAARNAFILYRLVIKHLRLLYSIFFFLGNEIEIILIHFRVKKTLEFVISSPLVVIKNHWN
jgi:hypothetical protein